MQGSSLKQRKSTSPRPPQPQAATTNHYHHHHPLTDNQHHLVVHPIHYCHRSEGAFSPSAGSTVDTSSMQNSLSSSSFFSGGCQHFDFLKPGETEKLKVLFARAIHRTATPYSAFEHPAWKDFFRALRSSYQIPCRTVIG